jgi:imidazolonepropionase-like amidohydrolase
MGADIYAAGPFFTSKHGHGSGFGLPIRAVDTPADAVREVTSFAKKNPDAIKVVYDHAHPEQYGSMDRATMEAVIATAKKQGIRTVVHIGTWEDAKEAANAGASAITHLYGEAVIPDELVQLMKAKGIPSIPTMTYQTDLQNLRDNPTWLDSPLLAAVTTPQLLASYRAIGGFTPSYASVFAEQTRARPNDMQSLKKLGEGGVKIMTGTDSGAGDIAVFHGYSVHREMQIMVDAGLSPWLALAAGTTLPNEFLGLPSGLRVGSPANLVVLDADPTSDIRNTEKISAVILHGRIVDRTKLVRRLASAAK